MPTTPTTPSPPGWWRTSACPLHLGEVGMVELDGAGHALVLHQPGGEGVVGVVGVHGPAASGELQGVGAGTGAEVKDDAAGAVTSGRCDRLRHQATGRATRRMGVQCRPITRPRRIHGSHAVRWPLHVSTYRDP